MKSIYTLIPDIHNLIRSKHTGWFDEELAQYLSQDISRRLVAQLGTTPDNKKGTLRLSRMGPQCPRALWYSVHHPELAEALPPWAEIKYSFGHIIEGLTVALAKAAGHHVCGEQDELELDGIVGHRDCVIDGVTVDIKSASSIGFQKFKSPEFERFDDFGYLDQLDGYVVAALDHPELNIDQYGQPIVTDFTKGYILAIDKVLGHMCLYQHTIRQERIRQRIKDYKKIIALPTPPACECELVSDGKSGNIKLGTRASYSLFKFCCHPLLRTFKYSNGPVFLTKVIRLPDVPELTNYAKII